MKNTKEPNKSTGTKPVAEKAPKQKAKTKKQMLEELGFKYEISRQERYIINYCKEFGVTITKVKQYVSKTYFWLEYDGMNLKFELPSTVSNIRKYATWIETMFKQEGEIRRYKELCDKTKGVSFFIDVRGYNAHNEPFSLSSKKTTEVKELNIQYETMLDKFEDELFKVLFNEVIISIQKMNVDGSIKTIDSLTINYIED